MGSEGCASSLCRVNVASAEAFCTWRLLTSPLEIQECLNCCSRIADPNCLPPSLHLSSCMEGTEQHLQTAQKLFWLSAQGMKGEGGFAPLRL